MVGRIFSPGKLMLTSEYAALDGALVLAVPTKPGQEFYFNEKSGGSSVVRWRAYHADDLWLDADIDYASWQILQTNLPEAAGFVLKTLRKIQQKSATKFQNSDDYLLETRLQFPPDYGLGSSATLMSNLAEWAGIDAFALNDACLGGSGYDVAVAQAKSPVLFQFKDGLRSFEKIHYRPDFCNELIFIHLNKKQNSREGISQYRALPKSPQLVAELSAITRQIEGCASLQGFSLLMTRHESLLAQHLRIPTAKERWFSDCPVFIKSLGAWGGDFVMSQKFPGFEQYFSERNFNTVFSYPDLIL